MHYLLTPKQEEADRLEYIQQMSTAFTADRITVSLHKLIKGSAIADERESKR
ncbi:hypothetical protein J6590_005542 [Homalodisca vitripennis]|nr:hypothetical protein J6590_005542 [Homalodisca vitripennis]